MKLRRLLISVAVVVVLGGLLLIRLRSVSANDWPLVNAETTSRTVLCYGDSLVAGEGAESDDMTYPKQLGQILGVPVLASGVRGETSEAGWRRLQGWRGEYRGIVVVTLGGNDILRQVKWQDTELYLGKIFREFQSRGALVAFTSVHAPWARSRRERYHILCREHGVLLIPDTLAGILTNDQLLSDSIHPNSRGYRLMAERVSAQIGPYLPMP